MRFFISDEQPNGWRRLTFLIMIYGAVGVASLLFAADYNETLHTLFKYAKDAIIAIIIIIMIQRADLLRLTVWAILASGILLGTIGVYQHLTGTFENDYWGLGIAFKHHIIGRIDEYRISGTLGEPNFFALFMAPLIPLGLNRVVGERRLIFKVIAAWAVAVSLFAVVFSYSRGGFLSLLFMLIIYLILKPRRLWLVILFVIIAIPLMHYSANSNYINRMVTLKNIFPSTGPQVPKEASFKGRKSEMLVAISMFIDRPIFGLGLGNYYIHYQKYAHKLYLDLRREDRRAHSRYLEVLAETGLVGFAVFSTILFMMFYGLWQARKKTIEGNLPDLQGYTTAIVIGMVGILCGYMFLHDSWPRFFWLFVGIAFAITNVVQNEIDAN